MTPRYAMRSARGRAGDPLSPRRPAFALPVALLAIVLLAALAAGAALGVVRDAREGDDALLEPRALGAADVALANMGWIAWDRSWNLSLAIGATIGPDTILTAGGARGVVRATRTDAATFWLVAEGQAAVRTGLNAWRRVALLARLAIPSIVTDGAVTVRGALTLGATSRVAGRDTVPVSWSGICPPASGGVAGVVAGDTTRVCDGTCGAPPSRISGLPPLAQDVLAQDTAHFSVFGDESWSTLSSRADVTLPAGAYRPRPSIVGGRCDLTDALSWGDPSRSGACADRYPVVHISGDFTGIPGGTGQGVLLVDGDVRIPGGFTFAGIIVARGNVVASGLGNAIIGAVLAADAAGGASSSTIDGDSRIAYSRCVIDRVLSGSSPLVPARERAWTRLY